MGTASYEHSFNLIALNIIIGLTKNSRFLRPFSEKFSKELGYSLFSIENEFVCSSAKDRINPDIIVTSNKLGNSLLFEISHANIDKKIQVNNSGKSQIDRYMSIEKEYLSSIAAIPSTALTSYDVPHIVENRNCKGFEDYFGLNPKIPFPLIRLSHIDGSNYEMKLITNSFANNSVSAFFSDDVKISRINYYITIDFSNLSDSVQRIFDKCVSYIIQFLYKKSKDDNFSAEEALIKVFSEGIWNSFNPDKKKYLVNATTEFINQLIKRFPPLGDKFFKPLGNGLYRINVDDKNKEQEINKIIKRLHELTDEIVQPDTLHQLKLFDDNEFIST